MHMPDIPSPMSLCKPIAFLSYKLTGITAVKEASAPCCTLKLWVVWCHMELIAPLSRTVLGSFLPHEREVLKKVLQNAWGKELPSLASNKCAEGGSSQHKTHSDFSFHAKFQMQVISSVARFLKLSGQELLYVIFLYTFDWTFFFRKETNSCLPSPLRLRLRKKKAFAALLLTVQYLLIILLEAAAISWAF